MKDLGAVLAHTGFSFKRTWESAERTTRKACGIDGTADLSPHLSPGC